MIRPLALRCPERLHAPPPLLALAFALAFALAATPLLAATPEPPVPPEWLTEAEATDFAATSSYDETLAFLERLQKQMPDRMRLLFFGSSGEGRRLPLVVISQDDTFTAKRARASGKPILLIQSGIHAGEIDGKDATLMILRDWALGRHRGAMAAGTILFVPIYNADGHERVSPYNRPNQDGPREGMGFRTTTAGLDLNRDHMKLASEEARSLVALVNQWRPHLHIDNHVTDGTDLAWVFTYDVARPPQVAPGIGAWLDARLGAALEATERAGHPTGLYPSLVDDEDPAKGLGIDPSPPRYSTGYFPLRNRPSILVEMHSYKPYRQRVLANRDFLLALLGEVAKDPRGLVAAVEAAEARTVAAGREGAPASEVALDYEAAEETRSLRVPFYEWTTEESVVTGEPLLRYRRGVERPVDASFPLAMRATRTVARPRGYYVLPGWDAVEARLRGHGLVVERLEEPAEIEVETLRVAQPKYAATTYQGLTRVESVEVTRGRERRRLPAGTLWVPADQPDFEVAVHLLEPDAPDSLLSWGLLSSVFERKEYIEPRVLEELAKEMLARDPALATEWKRALEDEAFAADGRARYAWWYRRTPYWDETVGLLPYFRALARPAVATRPWR